MLERKQRLLLFGFAPVLGACGASQSDCMEANLKAAHQWKAYSEAAPGNAVMQARDAAGAHALVTGGSSMEELASATKSALETAREVPKDPGNPRYGGALEQSQRAAATCGVK